MADWGDYYSGNRVDSLPRLVALRHHKVRAGGSIPRAGQFQHCYICLNCNHPFKAGIASVVNASYDSSLNTANSPPAQLSKFILYLLEGVYLTTVTHNLKCDMALCLTYVDVETLYSHITLKQ